MARGTGRVPLTPLRISRSRSAGELDPVERMPQYSATRSCRWGGRAHWAPNGSYAFAERSAKEVQGGFGSQYRNSQSEDAPAPGAHRRAPQWDRRRARSGLIRSVGFSVPTSRPRVPESPGPKCQHGLGQLAPTALALHVPIGLGLSRQTEEFRRTRKATSPARGRSPGYRLRRRDDRRRRIMSQTRLDSLYLA